MENIICSVIDVDCYPNDPEDVKFGGPKFVGFEFWVKKSDKELMTNYVKCMLYEYGIPFININNSHYKIVNEKDIHTPLMIRSIIEENKDNKELKPKEYYYRKIVK